jgi:hypothetical protein
MKIYLLLMSRIGFLSVLGFAALLFNGCDTTVDGNGTSASTNTGPTGGAAFSGTSVSFNPTVTFTSGTSFSWSNVTGDNPALVITTVGVPATGTFTYVPSGDYRTGTLSFLFTDPLIPARSLTLSNFVGTSSGITSFSLVLDSVSYNASVLAAGAPLIPSAATTGGGTGGGDSANTISLGTTYNGVLAAPVDGISFGSASGSLTPASLPSGATSFRVASDRARISFNGRTVGLTAGSSVPSVGSTGVYALVTSATSVTTLSVVYDTSGVAVGSIYTATALSADATAQKSISQNIGSVVVAL